MVAKASKYILVTIFTIDEKHFSDFFKRWCFLRGSENRKFFFSEEDSSFLELSIAKSFSDISVLIEQNKAIKLDEKIKNYLFSDLRQEVLEYVQDIVTPMSRPGS